MAKEVDGNEFIVFFLLFAKINVNLSINVPLYNDGQDPKPHTWVPWDRFATGLLHGADPDALRQGRPEIQQPQGLGPGMIPPGFEQFLKNHSSHRETYLYPYWAQGHWVFDRDAVTRQPKYLIDQTYPPHRSCNQPCLMIYESYGLVCGQRYSNEKGVYMYKNFVNICELEYENCKIKSKLWTLIHRDQCYELKDYKMQGDLDVILKNKDSFIEAFENGRS